MQNKKEKPCYNIKAVTYTKKLVGTDERGRKQYETVGTPTEKIVKETNFKDLKRSVHESSVSANSKRPNSVYVDYEDTTFTVANRGGKLNIKEQPKKLKSVTQYMPNGDKKVTYYVGLGNDEAFPSKR